MIINDLSKGLEISKKVPEPCIFSDGTEKENRLGIVIEHYLDIYINEQLALKLVCSPSDLLEMVIGRLITEQFIRHTEEIESIYICEYGSKAKIYLKDKEELTETIKAEPTCCTGNLVFLKNNKAEKLPPLPYHEFDQKEVFLLANAFSDDSFIHKATKGAHCCYLMHKGEIVYAVEDIGRHNALDKAIGYIALQNFDPLDCMVFTTGRVPTDMVGKVAAAGIPTLISKAVPTDKALEMAEYFNMNLICRAWPDKISVMVRSKPEDQRPDYNTCNIEGM